MKKVVSSTSSFRIERSNFWYGIEQLRANVQHSVVGSRLSIIFETADAKVQLAAYGQRYASAEEKWVFVPNSERLTATHYKTDLSKMRLYGKGARGLIKRKVAEQLLRKAFGVE